MRNGSTEGDLLVLYILNYSKQLLLELIVKSNRDKKEGSDSLVVRRSFNVKSLEAYIYLL